MAAAEYYDVVELREGYYDECSRPIHDGYGAQADYACASRSHHLNLFYLCRYYQQYQYSSGPVWGHLHSVGGGGYGLRGCSELDFDGSGAVLAVSQES